MLLPSNGDGLSKGQSLSPSQVFAPLRLFTVSLSAPASADRPFAHTQTS
jgi:hypothetical protein